MLLRLARPLGLALLCAAAMVPISLAREPLASASVVVALTVDDLVDRSEAVVVAIPRSRTSRWEGGRIVTYTTVAIDSGVAGGMKAGDLVVVRTLGGVVGDLGQRVFGEAVLPLDAPVMLFLRAMPPQLDGVAATGSRGVVGMSQGAMPIVVGVDKQAHIGLSAQGLELTAPVDAKDVPAVTATQGRLVTDVASDVRTRWTAHGKN